MASDAYLSPLAEAFLARLTPESRAYWWGECFDQFLANPINDGTVAYPEAGEADAKATPIGLFVVIFRAVNSEVIAIANIKWGPNSPAGNPDLAHRL